MTLFPCYRREENTDYGGPEDTTHEWTMHIIEWFGYEFVLKVPRKTWGVEAPMADRVTPADDESFGEHGFRVTGLPQMCPECAAKYSRGVVA